MKMHRLLWLVVVAAPVLFSGCNSEEYDQVNAEIRALDKEIGELRAKNNELSRKKGDMEYVIQGLKRTQSQEESILRDMALIGEYENKLESAVTYVDSQVGAWKSATRRSLVGKELGLVRLKDGRSLSETKVKAVSDDTVTLQFDGGEEEVLIADLSEQVRIALVHEPSVLLGAKVK